MNRGEIWYFEFKKPNKARPVLILTRRETIPLLETVTVVPITSTLRGVPSEVPLGEKEGLKGPCAANLHHIVTVPKSGLHRFVGSLSAIQMNQIREAMLFAFGFDEI